MKAAFFYASDPPPVRGVYYGRGAANRGLWLALAQHGSGDTLHCVTPDREMALDLRGLLDAGGCGARTLVRLQNFTSDLPALGLGTLFRNDPNLPAAAWTRRACGADTAYGLCGLTHTLTPIEAMRWISDSILAPMHPWDALICTSQAARRMVEALSEAWSEHLRERLGIGGRVPISLPVIPLGIDTGRFAAKPDDAATRARWRARLGIGEEDAMVLFLGRLSYYEKAHPYPMHAALELAARRTRRTVHLVQAGRFPDPAHEALYRDNAARFAPSVRTHIIDGADPELDGLWAAGDIFTSLSDNVQETFGLTPVEAMAAGLPVVVSDWDGYRDTVEHGVTGLRVRTVMAPAGSGTDIANLYLHSSNYPRHLGLVSQCTAVDVAEAAEAYLRLIEDRELRAAMGAAGRRRAVERYDWSRIIPQYETLWAELDAMRAASRAEGARWPTVTPLSPDPFRLYAAFPTASAADGCRLRPVDDWRERVAAICDDPLNQINAPAMPAQPAALLERVEVAGRPTLGALLASFPADRHASVRQTVVWLMKMHLLTIEAVG